MFFISPLYAVVFGGGGAVVLGVIVAAVDVFTPKITLTSTSIFSFQKFRELLAGTDHCCDTIMQLQQEKFAPSLASFDRLLFVVSG